MHRLGQHVRLNAASPLFLSEWPSTTDVPSAIPTILNCVNEGPAGIKEQYLSFVCVIVFELSVFGVSFVSAIWLTISIDVLLLTLWNLKINAICMYCPDDMHTSADIRCLGWHSRDKNPLIYAFHRDSNSPLSSIWTVIALLNTLI